VQGTKAQSAAGSSFAAKPATEASNPGVHDPAGTALAEFCHTLMNSAAFIYID